jgi:hypothetical protein
MARYYDPAALARAYKSLREEARENTERAAKTVVYSMDEQ